MRSGSRAGAVLIAAVVVVGATGCGSADPDSPAAPTTTTAPASTPVTSSAPAGSPTATTGTDGEGGVDCAAAQEAQQELDEAYSAQLDELGIGRGDPRAQTVYALVTTTEGPDYYSALAAAVPPELADDARRVLEYYEQVAAAVGEVDYGDGSRDALARAGNDLAAATEGVVGDPETGTAVVQAQERLQSEVQRACADGGTATPEETTGGQDADGEEGSGTDGPTDDGPTGTATS